MITMKHLAMASVFLSVAKHESFSAAALENDLSSASVTNHIKQLEQRLNLKLFHRTTRNVKITKEGTAFLDMLTRVEHEITHFASTMDEQSQSLTGPLAICAPLEFGCTVLPKLIKKFQQKHPGVSFNLSLSNQNVDLIEDQYDLAIRGVNFNSNTRWDTAVYKSRKLREEKIVVCASPKYLSDNKRIVTIDDLLSHSFLLFKTADGKVLTRWRFKSAKDTKLCSIQGDIVSDSIAFLVSACAEGLGLLITTQSSVEKMCQEKKITILEFPLYQLQSYYLHAIYPREKNVSLRLRKWIDFLVEELKAS